MAQAGLSGTGSPSAASSRDHAVRAAAVAKERRGEDIVVLDMRDVTLVADYFVILTGTSVRHVDTLADYVEEALQDAGARLIHREGRSRAHWVLLDYGDIIVHIFTPDERRYYDLDRLWGDARIVSDL
jgi:ribosome-associated protein